MARGRMISKSLSTSEKFAALGDAAGPLAEFCQTLYPLVVVHSDDFGRLQGDAFTVKHTCFPTSPRTVAEFSSALSSLSVVGLICLYQVSEKRYIQIENFDPHQSGLHKRTKSTFPEVPGIDENFPVKRTELKGRELKGTKDKNSGVPPQSRPQPVENRLPAKNVKIITKIAHEVLKNHNGHVQAATGSDLCDEIKALCATRHIAYDAEVVRKALDSAEVQRKPRIA